MEEQTLISLITIWTILLIIFFIKILTISKRNNKKNENDKDVENFLLSEKINSAEEVKIRFENRAWLKYSQEIAVGVLFYSRENGISRQELSIKSGLSVDYIEKIIKGQENITLETISKLEKGLGRPLIKVLINE